MVRRRHTNLCSIRKERALLAAGQDGADLEADVHRDDRRVAEAKVEQLHGQPGLGGEGVGTSANSFRFLGAVTVAVVTFVVVVQGVKVKVEAAQTEVDLGHHLEAGLVLVLRFAVHSVQSDLPCLACTQGQGR